MLQTFATSSASELDHLDATAVVIAVEEMDPAGEYAYWRDKFANRPYVAEGASFDDYGPAYVFGIHASAKYADRGFEEVEAELEREWHTVRGDSTLEWAQARDAASDSWEHSRRDLPLLPADAVAGPGE